jgi:hypothetical protein
MAAEDWAPGRHHDVPPRDVSPSRRNPLFIYFVSIDTGMSKAHTRSQRIRSARRGRSRWVAGELRDRKTFGAGKDPVASPGRWTQRDPSGPVGSGRQRLRLYRLAHWADPDPRNSWCRIACPDLFPMKQHDSVVIVLTVVAAGASGLSGLYLSLVTVLQMRDSSGTNPGCPWLGLGFILLSTSLVFGLFAGIRWVTIAVSAAGVLSFLMAIVRSEGLPPRRSAPHL